MADENKWMTMTRKGKLDTEMKEAINQGEQQRGGTPKRKKRVIQPQCQRRHSKEENDSSPQQHKQHNQ
eukprot:6645032-Ditylum_brightwellii.AAC.1